MDRKSMQRVDVGSGTDCLLVGQSAGQTSLIVSTGDGEASLQLGSDQCESLIRALRSALDNDRSWSVWRQGDDGNPFIVKDGLTQAEAKDLVAIYEARKHKQTYWTTSSKN